MLSMLDMPNKLHEKNDLLLENVLPAQVVPKKEARPGFQLQIQYPIFPTKCCSRTGFCTGPPPGCR